MLALLMPFFGPIVDKLVGMIPDPVAQEKARAEAMAQIITAAQAADQAQNDVNKSEAASGSIFVGGWRPFIGWVCGAALAFQYIIRPLATMALTAMQRPDIILPGLDDNLWQLMLGMLGMGGLRTYEKAKGVAS
ncbi:Holin of 3TMs, for gene-transfer release [uncultured Caudovirales phage]|uniref:Holin of 3TMs, for gene-transfer release n=1 Tax=uncultured Caudovirales phage TaxID=2100421 RepID=A0A6J5SV12_9CAUD|nr:Holin of 3TMs, for gene-transfer release [uncultured Caudovirales phage]